MSSRILNKVIEIEAALSKYDKRNISLLTGSTGIALFYSHLFELTGEKSYRYKCISLVESVCKRLGRINIHHSFCNGFTGVAWGIKYLTNCGILEDFEDNFLDLLDDPIYQAAKEDLYNGVYDFLHGAMGAAIYALETLENEKANLFLENFVNEIDRLKQEDEFGFKWEDPIFPISDIKQKDIKVYNLGMAHGMLSIIEILRKIYSKGILKNETKKLINGGISWIRHNRRIPSPGESMYPACVYFPISKDETSRLAWCYGDLTLALVFWKSGKTFKDLDLEVEAIEIMQNSNARLDPLRYKYLDACVCHGTSGISHLFYKFYRETGDQIFKERSDFWTQETLDQSRANRGLAGYRIYNQTQLNQKTYHRWRNSYGILEGIAGIGLVLMNQLNNKSEWDKCLLLT